MGWVLVGLLALTAGGIALGVGHGGNRKSPPGVVRIMGCGREKLRLMLSRVEREPAPEPVMGAMCYEPMCLPDRIEYICPSCGGRTLYDGMAGDRISWELPVMRRMVEGFGGNQFFRAFLEEGFCDSCHSGEPSGLIRLVLVYADGDTVRNSVGLSDIQMIDAFIRGRLSYTDSYDATHPLRDGTGRLRTLLGLR